MSVPDSLRDTLAHALLGTPNVSVYGVGDERENALTAADFMLREYDWPWPVAGAVERESAAQIADGYANQWVREGIPGQLKSSCAAVIAAAIRSQGIGEPT